MKYLLISILALMFMASTTNAEHKKHKEIIHNNHVQSHNRSKIVYNNHNNYYGLRLTMRNGVHLLIDSYGNYYYNYYKYYKYYSF